MDFLDYIPRPDFILFLISLLFLLSLYLYRKYKIFQRKRAMRLMIERFARYTPEEPLEPTDERMTTGSCSSTLSDRDTASSPVSSQREAKAPRSHIDGDVNLAPAPAAASRYDKYFIVRATISGIILVAALFIILKGTHPKASMEWSYGAIGLIIGYWLK